MSVRWIAASCVVLALAPAKPEAVSVPADTYNGMILIIGKNVDRKAGRTVHIVDALQRIGAALKRQTPPDSYLWIVTEDVPAFRRFEGPLSSGPVWRVELTRPGGD